MYERDTWSDKFILDDRYVTTPPLVRTLKIQYKIFELTKKYEKGFQAPGIRM
jgi:hypothetical protein